MANQIHLDIINEGVEAWNKWRAEHPFRVADLSGANLHGRNLNYVNFAFTVLDKADLGGCSLYYANFNYASANDTVFRNAKFGRTIVGVTNLEGAIGLDTIEHRAPSYIDLEKILAIPESVQIPFFRGIGMPQSLIDYLPALLAEPIQFYSCFISYSTSDEPFAKRLEADLQSNRVRCWFAPRDIQGGKKIHEQIDQAIRMHDRLLLVLSPHSIESEWVRTEIAYARRRERIEKRRVLFPISLTDFQTLQNWTCFDADSGKDSAREIREFFIPDFSSWKNHDSYTAAFDRLLRDLKAEEKP